jgi:5-hmdU DNA kinase-like protein
MTPNPTVVFDTYWKFAAERQHIYELRLAGAPQPWTNDPILQTYKFTSCFRAADRVSQYLIREVIYNPYASSDDEEVVFRILLFKFFNSITTWELLTAKFGIPTWKGFNETAYVQALDAAITNRVKIWNAAYMQNDLSNYEHVSPKKHPRYLRLLKNMMSTNVTGKLQAARTYRDAFFVLYSYPLHKGFIGMQHLCDLNYSPVINFSEDDFIIPGPGALRGIQKCFAYGRQPTEAEAVEVIEACVAGQEHYFADLGLQPVTLFGRRLHAIDCQNLFCEVDKYARVAHPQFNLKPGARIKQTLKPKGPLPKPFFPPKWGLP